MPRILVVDDDAAVCSTIRTLLQHQGYEVTVARNGREGIRALEAASFDAILVDIFMPGMDGLEAINAFRGHAPGVPIVAMSGFMGRDATDGAPDFLAMARKLGADYSLHKPFRPKELFGLIETCLANRAPGSERRGQHSAARP